MFVDGECVQNRRPVGQLKMISVEVQHPFAQMHLDRRGRARALRCTGVVIETREVESSLFPSMDIIQHDAPPKDVKLASVTSLLQTTVDRQDLL